jgi:hypothetical protein
MSLPAPKLDNRTFADLVEEARRRIPQFTPEWTNFNDSDPGMALVKLHAWLTETLLFQMNRLPDLNYIKFLELLNVQPAPALPAHAELTFKLKKLNKPADPLVMFIPKGTQVGVDDPELDEDIIFETDRTLRAINAAIGALIAPGDTQPFSLMTVYDEDNHQARLTGQAFYPFNTVGADPVAENVWIIGLVLRPQRQNDKDYSLDRFPKGELDLMLFVPDVGDVDGAGNLIEGANLEECLFPWEVQAENQRIVWEVYTGDAPTFSWGNITTAWRRVQVVYDDTAGMSRSGHIILDMPGGLPAIALGDLAASRWSEIGYEKPAPDDDEAELPSVPEYAMVWLRARLLSQGIDDPIPQVQHVLLNTVSATAAVTRVDEIVGASNGLPNQIFKLKRTPVLVNPTTRKPDLTLAVRAGSNETTWSAVSDFYGVNPDEPVFLFDGQTGTVQTGDGRHGRIPVAGAELLARHYRYGGGAVGNVGMGTITALRTSLADVDSVNNVRAASGGRDPEPIEEVMLRAPHDLRTRDRAVTSDDFAFLATQTPGLAIKRAFTLAQTTAQRQEDGRIHYTRNVPGAVTVVVLPESKQPRPQPTEDQIRHVCLHLNQRRLITTQLFVVGPEYIELEGFFAEITVSRQYDLKTVRDAVKQALLDYFDPLHGGDAQQGWPFGGDVYYGHVYRQILNITGVLRVLCLRIMPANTENVCDGIIDDVLLVPEGQLVYLPEDVIELDVRYDSHR